MVGDPKQLPQTVVVPNAEETLYNRSMYERLKDCGIQEIMLDIQYRMHPQINELISNMFYDGKLKTAKSVRERPNMFPKLRQRILFFDVKNFEEQDQKSFKNSK